MEDWQLQHITNNLPKLVINTSCDSYLMSLLIGHGVFEWNDQAELEPEKNPINRAFNFYKLLRRKGNNAFDRLLDSLREAKQTGALEILSSCTTMSRQKYGASGTSLALISQDDFVPDKNIAEKEHAKQAIANYRFEMDKQLETVKLRDPEFLPKLHISICNDVINWCTKQKTMEQHELLSLAFALQHQFANKYEMINQMTFNGNAFSRADSEPAIGIDLGTTNCCVCLVWNNEVKVLTNKRGGKTTPSYIRFENSGSLVIGSVAKTKAYSNPKNTIFDSKRIIGRTMESIKDSCQNWPFDVVAEGTEPRILATGKRYRALEVSSLLLKECKEIAEKFLQKPVRKAVITVPAYFDQCQKQETKDAAGLAGLDLLGILNEPTAAAIAYKLKRLYQDTSKILVFDLGGGTFDVAVLEIRNKEIETIAVSGDASLGGEDFDRLLMHQCIEEFKKQTGIDITNPRQNKNVARSQSRLLLECEERKKDLGSEQSVNIMIDSIVEGHDLDVEITREKFELMCEPKFTKMIDMVQGVLLEKNISKEEIDDVILVGGSTRIPRLQVKLQNFFNGKKLNYSINPDEAVAYGAAVQAAILNGGDAKYVFEIEQVEDVIPLAIGVEATVNSCRGMFSPIIPKNTKYPTSMEMPYQTTHDWQTVASIRIYQGEDEIANKNTLIGEFMLDGIPKAKAGKEKVSIKMEIDKLGILLVTAVSKGSGGSKTLKVTLRKPA